MSGDPTLERIAQGNGLALCAAGSWTARFAPALERLVGDAEKLVGSRPNIFIDVSQVSKLDTFGAWLIERLRRSLSQSGAEAKIAGLSANYSSLVDEVRRVEAAPVVETGSVTISGMLEQIGRSVVGIGGTVVGLIDMLGAVLAAAGHVIIRPRGFRLTSTVHHLEQVCWRAMARRRKRRWPRWRPCGNHFPRDWTETPCKRFYPPAPPVTPWIALFLT